jgi:hypothetical protein
MFINPAALPKTALINNGLLQDYACHVLITCTACWFLALWCCAVGGKPVLTDVNSGRFNGAHSPKLFVELYAPRVSSLCWQLAQQH